MDNPELKTQATYDEEAREQSPILDGVRALSVELVDAYPQVDENGHLNYYLAGSLAVMLLASANRVAMLESTKIPEVEVTEVRDVPRETNNSLQLFVRKIGDLDYVPTEVYKEKQRTVNTLYDTDKEAYTAGRHKYLWKGGGGPQIADLSETAKQVLKRTDSTGVFCDPLPSHKNDKVCSVEVEGKEYYIADPRMMLAYKAVHIGESFDQSNKTEKMANDFMALLRALETMYSSEELKQTTLDTLLNYSPFTNSVFIPYRNARFHGELRQFFDEVLATDPDASYLDQLEYGKERAIPILNVLHRLERPDSKQAIVGFINAHRHLLDKWDVNRNSAHNREIVADLIISSHELAEDFSKHAEIGETRESLISLLETHPWAIAEYGKHVSDEALEHIPGHNFVLDVLMKLDEGNLSADLENTSQLLNRDMDAGSLSRMLDSEYLKQGGRKDQLFITLGSCIERLDKDRFNIFCSKLTKALVDNDYYDPKTFKQVKVEESQRPAWIKAIFDEFGLTEESSKLL